MTETVKKSADIQQAVDKIADGKIEQTEAEHIKQVAEKINEQDINEFFSATEYKEKYEQALNTIISSLENYKKSMNKPSSDAGLTIPKIAEQPKPLEFTFATPNKKELESDVIKFIEKLQTEKNKLPVGIQNQVDNKGTKQTPETTPNSTNSEKPTKTEIQKFDEFLKANNIKETFTDMFNSMEKSFKSMITENITKELLKSKRLIGKDQKGATILNELGNRTKEEIESKLTPERISNLTYSILNKLVEEAKKKIGKSNGNADVEIQEKAYLFMAMKNIIAPKQKTNSTEKSGLKGVSSDVAERIRAMVQPSTDLATIEKNLSIFIKETLKKGGFDIENSRKSIKDGANKLNYSSLDLARKDKRNETIVSVLGNAFENTFSYLNNTQGAEALLAGLLGDPSDKNKAFDPNVIINKEGLNLDAKTTPTPEQLSNLAKNLNEIVKGLPEVNTEPGKKDNKNLKEKLANGKLDIMLKQLDNLGPLKEIALMVINWLNNSKRGKSILEFFGKSYGLDKKQIEKLLERPLVKSGVDAYKDNIQKIQENGGSIEPISLDKDLTDRDIDTNYFRLLDNVVCTKTIDNTTGIYTYTIKKLDENGNLQEYPQAPAGNMNLTEIPVGDKKIYIDATGKVTNSDGSAFDASRNLMKEFIESDLRTPSFATAVSTMLVTKEPGNEDKIPALNFGNLTVEKRTETVEGLLNKIEVPNSIKELLKNNKYIFSTEDIVAHVLEKALEEYKKSKEGKVEANKLGIELTKGPYTLNAGTSPAETDYKKWIKIPDGKTATYSIDPTINRNNKKAGDTIKDLIVTVTIDGKANEIKIPAVAIETATTTPAATPAKTETPAPAAVPAKTPETPTTAKTPEATAKTT